MKRCNIYYDKSTSTEYPISINKCESNLIYINIRVEKMLRTKISSYALSSLDLKFKISKRFLRIKKIVRILN